MLFGGGLKMFDYTGDEYIRLEKARVIDTQSATHLRNRVVK